MDSSRRRTFLQAAVSGTVLGVSGCLRLVSGSGNETNAPTDTPTSTLVPVPDDASFSFDYSGGSLTIRLTGGGPIPASNLVIRSSDGTLVRWHELGSTAVPASGNVTSGDTATIGSSVLKWPNAVEQSETIRMVFMTEGGSPTTLDTFEPSVEETATETETPTETSSNIDFYDGFEDGNLDKWTEIVLNDPRNENRSRWEITNDAISGTYSAHSNTNGDKNLIRTQEPVLDMSGSITVSFSWRTSSSDSRGIIVYITDEGTENNGENPDTDIYGNIRWTDSGDNYIDLNGERQSISVQKIGQTHNVELVIGESSTEIRFGGESVSISTPSISGTRYLAFNSSGHWGVESTITIDEVTVQ